MPNAQFRLLFVCWGNICRSPAAENVMRSLAANAGLQERIEIDSAGTIDAHRGQAPDSRMSAAGKARGYAMTGRSRGVAARDFENFDLIVAMDYANLDDLRRMDRNDLASGKIRLFCEFCQEHDAKEVPDPYYGGSQGFERVLDLLEDGCQQILAYAKERIK